MLQLISAICLLCLPVLCLGEPIPFDQAHKAGDGLDALFSWGDANKGFALSARGVLTSKMDFLKPKLRLPIDKGEWIERLLVRRQENDLMLAFDTSDGDNGRGLICRIKWPLSAVQWCQTIPGFNVHASTGKDSIYLGAIGFVGRLDPKNGNYLWRHDDLYGKDKTFNIVCPAKEYEATVVFNATTGIRGSVVKQISLGLYTGKIIQTTVIGIGDVCQ